MKRFYTVFTSPLGPLLAVANAHGELTDLRFVQGTSVPTLTDDSTEAAQHPTLVQTRGELMEYFAGARRTFDVPLAPQGTPFQRAAWQALQRIPYGQTRSYGEQAQSLGKPNAARAVGAANGKNPIAILIPCHRVIGASGSLTGYASGLERKRRLLALEGVLLA